jgi:hypothetical protein
MSSVWSKAMFSASLLLSIIIIASVFGWYPQRPDRQYRELWNGEPELVDPRFHPSSKNESLDLSSYIAVTTKLKALLGRGEPAYLKEVYIHDSPDWHSGTAYVVLSDTSPEITQPILEQFSLHIQKDIRFLRGPAPLALIEGWKDTLLELCSGSLKERGVQWTSMSTHYNEKILLGVEEITPTTIDTVKEVVEGRVPPGIIVLWDAGRLRELADTTS